MKKDDVLQWTPTHGYTSVGRSAKSYIHRLFTETGYRLKDLLCTMAYVDFEVENGFMERLIFIYKKSVSCNNTSQGFLYKTVYRDCQYIK